jgi:hypothetical protein
MGLIRDGGLWLCGVYSRERQMLLSDAYDDAAYTLVYHLFSGYSFAQLSNFIIFAPAKIINNSE